DSSGKQRILFLDAVLHVATRAVQFLVQLLRRPVVRFQRGDQVTGVLFAFDLLGFGHYTPWPAPARVGLVSELGEHACRLAGLAMQRCRLLHLRFNDMAQALIACKAEHVIDSIGLTPAHERLAAEAGIGAQNDSHLRPALPDLLDRARGASRVWALRPIDSRRKRAKSNSGYELYWVPAPLPSHSRSRLTTTQERLLKRCRTSSRISGLRICLKKASDSEAVRR